MIYALQERVRRTKWWPIIIIILLLAASYFLGSNPSRSILALIAAGFGFYFLLQNPALGLGALTILSLLVPISFNTGTAVTLNLAALITIGLFGVLIFSIVRGGNWRLAHSRTFRPLLVFFIYSFLSLLIGNATWDPFVPRADNFYLVQLAQIALYGLSFGAFFLAANLLQNQVWLKRITWLFLIIGGIMVFLHLSPLENFFTNRVMTEAITRAPFWVLLAALAGGQLFFNRKLSGTPRLYLAVLLAVIIFASLVLKRNNSSIWVGVGAAMAVLSWFRFKRLRWLVILVVTVLALSGFLFPRLYEFAGGEDDWLRTGGSRLALINRVLEDTERNPITGIGPASYRAYGATRPLIYRQLNYRQPRISSHNNYVDIYSQFGLVGMAIFFWFVAEMGRLFFHLLRLVKDSFLAGYVYGVLGLGFGALVLMAFADWILPYVYNIGFKGFQASVLVWMFLGGVVAIENFLEEDDGVGLN